jgi:hypothetical protein
MGSITANINAITMRILVGEGEMTMRVLLVLAAIGFSATAFAQTAPSQGGQQTVGADEAEGLAWMQVRWDGQRHQTVGW